MHHNIFKAPTVRADGRYKFITSRGGVVTGETGWIKNIITNRGLDNMASDNYLNMCAVGTGSATPLESDIQLESYVRSHSSVLNSSGANSSVVPYYTRIRTTYRFNPYGSNLNLTEVMTGPSITSATSRTLIKDALGNPTALTVLGDETLDVVFELRLYTPTEDVTGQVVFTGNVGGTYDFISRACAVTSLATAANAVGWGIKYGTQSGQSGAIGLANLQSSVGAFVGDIGPVTGSPAGTNLLSTIPVSTTPYLDGTYSSRGKATLGLSVGGNNNIRSFRIKLGACCYQIEVDPPIPKNSSRILTLDFEHSWGRRNEST